MQRVKKIGKKAYKKTQKSKYRIKGEMAIRMSIFKWIMRPAWPNAVLSQSSANLAD